MTHEEGHLSIDHGDVPHSYVQSPGGKHAFRKLSYGQAWNDFCHSFVLGCYSVRNASKEKEILGTLKPDRCQNEKPKS